MTDSSREAREQQTLSVTTGAERPTFPVKSRRGNRPAWWRIFRARLYFARKMREWPWNVPWRVVYIGRKRPPESVARYFQRLHGLPEIGYVTERDLERGEELVEEHGWK